jgi:2,4-dienoyl-CoA reductase-like NADH-dependent reductase (Old Yellow Enzyme family)
MTHLFDQFKLRGVILPHRIAVSPMCQYSSVDGYPNDWHLVHLGSRAVGGASLVFTEATAVLADGRISPQDLGIWKDAHTESFAPIVRFLHNQGSVAGIQLAHAGRKAGVAAPWDGNHPLAHSEGGWTPVGPSPIPFSERYETPQELSEDGIRGIIRAFVDATRRSLEAGFEVIEIHAAHGYLLQEFLSPLSNHRTDRYGGCFDNRIRILCEVATEIRKVLPDRLPLFVRISATDWDENGWTVDDSVELARRLGPLGVDLVDCSSGNLVPGAKIPTTPGFQVPFAERIRREAGVRTAAVGLIREAAQADQIIRQGQADMVLLARQLLREPHWPLKAARELGVKIDWPVQYARAAE